MHNINHVNVDVNLNIVTAGGGAQLADFVSTMQKNGKALIGQVPSFGGVTVGGALGTGARGSSLLHNTSLSDQLIAVKIIDGQGNIRFIDESTPDDLAAFKVHLGVLGIIFEASFRIKDSYKMRVENYRDDDNILNGGTALRTANEYDWFQMWWFPNTQSVVVSKGKYVDNGMSGNASTFNIPEIDEATAATVNLALELGQSLRSQLVLGAIQLWSELSLYQQVPLRQPVFSEDGGKTLKNPAIGPAHGLMENRCTKCSWNHGDGKSTYVQEFGVGLDISQFDSMVDGIRKILRQQTASFPIYGIFIRFAPVSNALMSVEYGRRTVHVEIITPMRNNPFTTARSGLAPIQAIEQLLISLGGRPHFSMCGQAFHTKSMEEKNSPNIARFRTYMQKYDPNGIFLNKFGMRIKGSSNALTIDPKAKHCALQSSCICSSSNDCASGQICGKLSGFSVCKDFIAEILPLRLIDIVSDRALNVIASQFSP